MGVDDIGTEVFRLLGYGLVGPEAKLRQRVSAKASRRSCHSTGASCERSALTFEFVATRNISELAFAEYAHSAEWIDAHLGQFFGVTLLFLGFVSLAQFLKSDSEVAPADSTLGLALANRGLRREPERWA